MKITFMRTLWRLQNTTDIWHHVLLWFWLRLRAKLPLCVRSTLPNASHPAITTRTLSGVCDGSVSLGASPCSQPWLLYSLVSPRTPRSLEQLSQLHFLLSPVPLNQLLKLALWYLQFCLPFCLSPGVAPLIIFVLLSLSWLALRTAGRCE